MSGFILANKAIISSRLLFWRLLCQKITILTKINTKVKKDLKKV
jgi:hypothetical protein